MCEETDYITYCPCTLASYLDNLPLCAFHVSEYSFFLLPRICAESNSCPVDTKQSQPDNTHTLRSSQGTVPMTSPRPLSHGPFEGQGDAGEEGRGARILTKEKGGEIFKEKEKRKLSIGTLSSTTKARQRHRGHGGAAALGLLAVYRREPWTTFMSTASSWPWSLRTMTRTLPRPQSKALARRAWRLDWSMTGRSCLTSPVSVMATT